MSATSLAAPRALPRLRAAAAGVGLLGVAALGAGAVSDATQAVRSNLYGFLFWTGVSLGCLGLLMIQHLTGGRWGFAIRRILEAGSCAVVVAPLALAPVALALPRVYLWARPEAVAADGLLRHKAAYLNPSFFLGRAAFYLGLWIAMSHLLARWSTALDKQDDPRALDRMRMLSGGGLPALALTITFASIDWAMSLDPHWFSTIYGVIFLVGQGLSALAFVVVVLALLRDEEPLRSALGAETVHDLGKLLLAFVMLWAYVCLSQFLITWSGNLPEEIPWYLHRLEGGWRLAGAAIVLFHFALPFLLLLSRDLKRDARRLGVVAAAILAARMVDLFWLVGPDLRGHGAGLHWMDVAALAGIGGTWVAVFAHLLSSRPLVPLRGSESGGAAAAHG
jgi:hypothetical protein